MGNIVRSWDELKSQVDANGGVLTVEMGLLRDIHGAGKLGDNICGIISDRLKEVELAHFPDPLPTQQNQQARLYQSGALVAQLIEAVLSPSAINDKMLVERFGIPATDYKRIVEEIRKLVAL